MDSACHDLTDHPEIAADFGPYRDKAREFPAALRKMLADPANYNFFRDPRFCSVPFRGGWRRTAFDTEELP